MGSGVEGEGGRESRSSELNCMLLEGVCFKRRENCLLQFRKRKKLGDRAGRGSMGLDCSSGV